MNKKRSSIDGFRGYRRYSGSTAKQTSATGRIGYYRPKATEQKLAVQSPRDQVSLSKLKPKSTDQSNKRTRQSPSQFPTDLINLDHKQPSLKRRSAKRLLPRLRFVIMLIVAVCLGGVSLYGIKILQASNNIISGGIIGLIASDPLKQDDKQRTNFLIFGTESDNLQSQHGGPLLTDSLMLVSYNHANHQTSMISIPRDLWVKLENRCFLGDYAKVNTVYQCGSKSGADPKEGAAALSRKITAITGLDIHYYAHINFQAVIKLVDAVGGIEVVIESQDPRGIYDPNFDWQCNYRCNYVKYKNGPTGLMDGKHALALMRARNAQGGYGLPNSNFDREDNQRKVLTALAKKITSSGALSDISKVMSIIETLGDNLKTNLTTKEVRSMLIALKKISKQFGDDSMLSVSLAEAVRTGSVSGQSVVLPQAGIEQYQKIHGYIQRQISNQNFIKEKPEVVVLNGSDKAGIAQKLADHLSEQGFEINKVANAPANIGGRGQVFVKNGVDKPRSLKFLKQQYQLSDGDVAEQAKYDQYRADFIVVIGPDFDLN